MLRRTCNVLAVSPGVGIAPETTPIKYTPTMLNIQNMRWWNGQRTPYRATYRERSWVEKSRMGAFAKSTTTTTSRPVLRQKYSREALQAALKMVPEGFDASMVSRPPQRIRAQSEGIVGRWFTNYWTLHSIRYQCFLAGVPWTLGERSPARTNYEEPHMYVDFEESKAIRDYRTRWINVNRSLVGMTRRMKEAEEDVRYLAYKRTQEQFWSNRRVFVNRVKAMHNQGNLPSGASLPVRTFNIAAFMRE